MVRPTFASFEVARSAISVAQMGLNTVGHNISNVNTAGYTRQRVDQVSLSNSGINSKYRIYGANNQNAGQGALFNGISQIRDTYLDTRYRNEASTYGELSVKTSGLTELQSIIDEISTDGIGVKLAELISDLTKFAQSADDVELATVVRNSAKQFTQIVNKSANEIQTILDTQKNDLTISLENDVNATLEQIAYLNEKIREQHINGDPANELMDSRNLLIDQLSEFANIKVVNTPEKISDDITVSRLSIVMVDNTTAPASEFTLVDNKNYNTLKSTENADGTVSISLVEGGTDAVLKPDITDNFSKGAIKGYIDLINGCGNYAGDGENSFRGIPYYQKALDTFAQTFAATMNRLNSITNEESAATGGELKPFYDKNLFADGDGNTVDPLTGKSTITAANITISDMWGKEAWYLTTSKLSSSQQEDAREPVKDDNGNYVLDTEGNKTYVNQLTGDNINAMVKALTGSLNFSATNGNGDKFNFFTGTPEEFLTNMASTRGLDTSLCSTLLKASGTVISGYVDTRDSISAVSVDEEAINMMTYQNYYNAAARYMTTLDEALGTIIQSMGVVGR